MDDNCTCMWPTLWPCSKFSLCPRTLVYAGVQVIKEICSCSTLLFIIGLTCTPDSDGVSSKKIHGTNCSSCKEQILIIDRLIAHIILPNPNFFLICIVIVPTPPPKKKGWKVRSSNNVVFFFLFLLKIVEKWWLSGTLDH